MYYLYKNCIYFPERLGFFHPATDLAYVMDDYGNAINVPFCLGVWYFQEA